MKFKRNGEPSDKRYRAVKDALSVYSSAYLESVVDVLGRKRFGKGIKDNGPAFMAIAARYLLVERIDEDLIKAVAERMGLCEQIGRYKKAHGLPIHVPEREEEVLRRVEQLSAERRLPKGIARAIFKSLMEESKRLQERV